MKQGLQGELSHHLAVYRQGWALPRAFYRDEALYRVDVEQMLSHGRLRAAARYTIGKSIAYGFVRHAALRSARTPYDPERRRILT
jgi:hypothetical protein